MAMTDPIADMLTRIRNAGKANFSTVDIPGSAIKTEIARVLMEEGYIRNYKFIEDGKQGILRVYLKYEDADQQQPVVRLLKRISKPSRRVYVKAKDIRPVFNGTGIAILSTSKGIMTEKKAKQELVGGEIICNIW